MRDIPTVENNVVISAYVGVHQFCRVGRNVMIGALSKITQDVPPFCMIADFPPRLIGLNNIGLKRAGFTLEDLRALKNAFKKIFSFKSNTKKEAAILTEHENEFVRHLANFVATPSKRGVLTKRAGEILED